MACKKDMKEFFLFIIINIFLSFTFDPHNRKIKSFADIGK